jgi:sugar transferase (PEP-CTERM system associated)
MSIRIFRHYVSLPLLLLVIAEAAIHISAVFAAGTIRYLDFHFRLYSADHSEIALLPRAALYALVMLSVMTAFGLYSAHVRQDSYEYKARYLASFPAAALVMVIVFYAIPESFLGRGILALSVLFSLVGTLLAREMFFRLIGHEALKRRVLVLGSGSRALEVEALVERLGPGAGFHVVGFVSCGDPQPRPPARSAVLGDCKSLRALVAQHRIDEIVVGVRDRRNGHLSMEDLLECKLEGVSIVDLPTFFERETGLIQLMTLSKSWLVYSEGFYRNIRRRLLKNTFDICVSAAVLVVTLPVMLLAALAILLETGRPILYRQKRVGERGQVFEILKFRSMRVDAEKDGVARWARPNDDRITRVGRFLRQMRIDELPQLINVLRGDMSFVGPRPERPPFVTEISRNVPAYVTRHSVKPGITGWAQIRYPYGASVEDAVQKLQFDLYYVKNHSLFLDLVIMFQTAQVVLFGKGAR